MPYPYPFDTTIAADAKTRAFTARVKKDSRRLDDIADRNDQPHRPLNHIEQSAVHTIFGIGEFVDMARDALGRRLKTIPNGTQRLGLMQWAARSLFLDVLQQLDQESAHRFAVNTSAMALSCSPKRVGQPPKAARIAWDDDLADITEAAWRGTCELCSKSAAEARACPLKRAFDHMQMLDTCDNPACWYRAD